MIDHTGVKVSDVKAARAFYEKARAPLGYKMLMEIPPEYNEGRVVLGYGVPPIHVAFRAESREAVDAFDKAALSAGGRDNGPPGVRPHYHDNYYGAFVFDLDGHVIEAVCHAE